MIDFVNYSIIKSSDMNTNFNDTIVLDNTYYNYFQNLQLRKATVTGTNALLPNNATSYVLFGSQVREYVTPISEDDVDYDEDLDVATFNILFRGPTSGNMYISSSLFYETTTNGLNYGNTFLGYDTIAMSSGSILFQKQIETPPLMPHNFYSIRIIRYGSSGSDTANGDVDIDGAWISFYKNKGYLQ